MKMRLVDQFELMSRQDYLFRADDELREHLLLPPEVHEKLQEIEDTLVEMSDKDIEVIKEHGQVTIKGPNGFRKTLDEIKEDFLKNAEDEEEEPEDAYDRAMKGV